MSSPSNQYHYLSALLAAQTQPQVAPSLQRLIEREINISPGARSAASDSQNHLRDFLRAEPDRDDTFPYILVNADHDFLGGSFARHTKIWPLDDIDLYVPLDGANLIYIDNGARLPYTLLSDRLRIGNRLLLQRWTSGAYVSSRKLIWEFAKVLRRQYPRTEVRPNGQAVSLRMTIGETESEDGLGYDIVPCFSMKPDDPTKDTFYLMPDGLGGWVRTNPKLDTWIANQLQTFHNGYYRPVVKIMKHWNTARLNGVFSSYYIELALSRAFWSLKVSNARLGSISEGLTIGFNVLERAYQAGDQASWVTDAPLVVRPSLSLAQQVALSRAQTGAQLAWRLEQQGQESQAVNQWPSVLGESL